MTTDADLAIAWSTLSTTLRAWRREQILEAAVAFVNADPATALHAVDMGDMMMADELAGELLGGYPDRATRHAIGAAVRYEARRQAEVALADDEHPLAWGMAHRALERAIATDDEAIATCDECHGAAKGCGCYGGLMTDEVTALALRLRDAAIAAAWSAQTDETGAAKTAESEAAA